MFAFLIPLTMLDDKGKPEDEIEGKTILMIKR